MRNVDSSSFWTFAGHKLPEEQWRILEGMFGDWLAKKHGSRDAAFAKWDGMKANLSRAA